jgi:hypothetical protein
MMRRTVLLLVTTALALIAAGGIALAATFTCTTNPCDGTTDDDVITGTVNAETINGNAGNDEISARDANDTLNGEDGSDTMHGELGDDWLNGGNGPDQLLGEFGRDRLNGGAGNDSLDGGADDPSLPSYTDFYLLTANWGQDTITDAGTDAGGQDLVWLADDATAAAMPNLTVDLVSSSGPEYTDGNGNTVNWEGNIVEGAMTGSGDDLISQSPKVSNSLNGGAGNDTYKGFTLDPSGGDSIGDSDGTADVLDLSSRSLASARWTTPKYPSTSNVQGLRIDFHGGPFLCSEEVCDYITIGRYFDNTSTDVCASGPGPGLIESIKFVNGQSVDFEWVKRLLGCPTPDTKAPTVTNVVPADGEQNVTTETYVETTFHEPMDPDTINTSTFILTQQDSSTPVEATVGYDSYDLDYSVAWLYPNSELAPNTTYTATIKGGASGAKDIAGNALQEDYSWTFTTGTDTTPPATFILSGPSGTVNSTTDSFGFSSTESDATFECKLDNEAFETCTSPESVPDEGFLTEGTHTFEVRATDSDGNTDPTPDSRTWTVDATAPTINNVSPADQSQNVSLGTNVEATFSEMMNASTLTASTFTLTKLGSSIPVTATVNYSSTTDKASLKPSSDLAPNTTYTATVKGGTDGVKDSAGNALVQDYSWTFTTGPPPDTTAPKVSTATPTGTGVARGTNATATFSETMDPTTITTSTFKLYKCSSTTSTNCATQITNVTITQSTDRLKATLNPFGTSSTLLAGRTKFKVVVTTGAKDEAGNNLDQEATTSGNQNKVWYFTTGRS